MPKRPEVVKAVPEGIQTTVLERVYLGDMLARRLRLPGGHEIWSRRFAWEVPADEGQVAVGWERDAVSILPIAKEEP